MEKKDWPVLKGNECTLMVLSLHDATAWLAGEDEEIIRWFDFPHPSTRANVLAAINEWRGQWRNDGPVRQWGIRADGHLAGGVELRERGDRRANLSYLIFPAFRRRGLAAEAITLATAWALGNMRVNSVVAIIHVENAASRATAERSGFVIEGPAERWEYDESGPSLRYACGSS